jgi:2-polyprenyl-3-methyl-5-hydroxy-6-metoxy-1,4-benzoquinol methylase
MHPNGRKRAVGGLDLRGHCENVYRTKGEHEVGWFEQTPAVSLDLIHATGVMTDAPIVDIGGGASRLVDALLDEGFEAVTVLDLSNEALAISKARLGARSAKVQWIATDITAWDPSQTYDVWHDRAAFHFLTDPKDRAAHAERVLRAVRPGGHVIIGMFAMEGPQRCSGLPVVRHDAASLGQMLGPSFDLVESCNHAHQTPTAVIQRYQFSRFRRLEWHRHL